jgi:hypothetical protein
MKNLSTYEDFLNEAKKSNDVITLKKFLSKDHNALWKWMQKEFGQKYSPGLQRIAGPLTHGGDFTLDVSNWDEKDIKSLKDYLSSNGHVFESELNETYKHKHAIGDMVTFDRQKARVEKVYYARNGNAMYTIGSSKHGNIDVEAEDID